MVFCIGPNDLVLLFIASIMLAAGDKNGSAVTLLSNVSTTFTKVYFQERILRTLRLNEADWSKTVIFLFYFLKIANFAYFFFLKKNQESHF